MCPPKWPGGKRPELYASEIFEDGSFEIYSVDYAIHSGRYDLLDLNRLIDFARGFRPVS